jgi:Fe-S-cluster containining protein
MIDPGRLSEWVKFKPALCETCVAHCCRLPLEVTASDLIRMGLATESECQGSLKKLGKRLVKEGVVNTFRGKTGLFLLQLKSNGDCRYLSLDRKCTIYEKRPEVCRQFPQIGPKPTFCPYEKKT